MQKHTILVIDDEPDVVKSVQDLLRLDYRVLGATRAADALTLMESEDIQVVMTDQRMPQMTGVEFLQKVRSEHPEAIRLLFTGYADIKAVIDAINQGNVYRYITKPWDPEELQGLIREAVERYALMVERKELFGKLQAQNRALEHANAELNRANQLKLAFIQVASHELRTPLTILMGFARVAQRPGVPPGENQTWLARIEHAGKRLQHLVDQIITMLMANQFEGQIQRTSTPLAPLLNEAADDVRPFIELRDQHLLIDIQGDLESMPLDSAKIRDAVNHLLLNAIKFTPDGGNISLGAMRLADRSLQISITDNGAGLDADSKQRLFEPFFTGFSAANHSSGHYEHGKQGLGLGLSIVRAAVEQHGGKITVESEPKRGSTFIIVLPDKQGASDAATSRAHEHLTAGVAS